MAVGDSIGDPAAARWLHYGMTSNDVVDTAQALQIRAPQKLIGRGLVMFGEILDLRAHEFRCTPQIGRTRWHSCRAHHIWPENRQLVRGNQRNIARFPRRRRANGCRQNFRRRRNASHLGPEMEERICKRLGLSVAPVASQVIQREPPRAVSQRPRAHRRTLEKIALEIRHLQRTKSAEVEEPFSGEQRGLVPRCLTSQPVTCEQICGLARVVRSNMLAAFENVGLWHERDISHSSVERIILPDSTILVDYMLSKMTAIIGQMRVFPERMMRNLESTHGLVYSGELLAGSGGKGHAAGRCLQGRCRKTPWRAWESDTSSMNVFRMTRASQSISIRKRSLAPSICSASFAMWTPSSTASLARIQPVRNLPRGRQGKP